MSVRFNFFFHVKIYQIPTYEHINVLDETLEKTLLFVIFFYYFVKLF